MCRSNYACCVHRLSMQSLNEQALMRALCLRLRFFFPTPGDGPHVLSAVWSAGMCYLAASLLGPALGGWLLLPLKSIAF